MKQVIKKKVIEKYNISTEEPILTVLFDMNSVMKMALVDKRMNGRGEEYGMVFQTFILMKRILKMRNWNFAYAMYDGYNSGILRYNLYSEYKMNRGKNYNLNSVPKTDYEKYIDEYCRKVMAYSQKKRKHKEFVRDETEEENFNRQRDIIFSCLEELFVRQVMCDNVEGDDLIPYYCKNKKPNEKILIVSGDRDLTQLINDDVCVYATQLRKTITKDNAVELLGHTQENVVIKKMLCGDVSDNIVGIKGMGETTFFQLFPEAKETKMDLEAILERSKVLNEERIANKKKPLKSLENVLNRVTDGCQGEYIYDINRRIIDLSEPMLTEEAKEELDNMIHIPLDPDGRDYKNLYRIVQDNNMTDILSEDKFGTFFSDFNKIMENEKKFFKSGSQ